MEKKQQARGSRSRFITAGGRRALEILSETFVAETTRRADEMDADALDAWEKSLSGWLARWADELEDIADRGVEYEMMLDLRLNIRLIAEARRKSIWRKNAKQ